MHVPEIIHSPQRQSKPLLAVIDCPTYCSTATMAKECNSRNKVTIEDASDDDEEASNAIEEMPAVPTAGGPRRVDAAVGVGVDGGALDSTQGGGSAIVPAHGGGGVDAAILC